MRLETRAEYRLVTKNTMAANAIGLVCGDVLAVFGDGSSAIFRRVATGPPVGKHARVEAEGSLVALEPTRSR